MSSAAVPRSRKIFRETIEIGQSLVGKVTGMPYNYLNFTSDEIDDGHLSPDDEKENMAVALTKPRRTTRMVNKPPPPPEKNEVTLKSAAATAKPSTSTTIQRSTSYPKTIEMIVEAVHALGEENKRKGVSVPAIKKWIKARYPEINPTRLGNIFRKSITAAVETEVVTIYPKPKPDTPAVIQSVLMNKYRLNNDKIHVQDNIVRIKKTTTIVKIPKAASANAAKTAKLKPKPKPKVKSKSSISQALSTSIVKIAKAKLNATAAKKRKLEAKPKTRTVSVSSGPNQKPKKQKALGSAIARRRSIVVTSTKAKGSVAISRPKKAKATS